MHSEPGKGTTFKVLLPASTEPVASEDAAVVEDSWKAEGTVLLVDDEQMIRDVGLRMLERLGFSVLTASDGVEAVDLYVEHREEIVCVLLDLTMPRMDGQERFRRLREFNGDVPIVLMSGFNEQEVRQKFVGRGLAGFVQKPFQRADLRLQIKTLLG